MYTNMTPAVYKVALEFTEKSAIFMAECAAQLGENNSKDVHCLVMWRQLGDKALK